MNIRLVSAITILCLCFILGFDQISYSLNKVSKDNISELKILKYIPEDNKTLFISNSKSSKIISNIKKAYNTNDQESLILLKNSILAYLGIDIGTKKLEDIYDNELLITTSDNKEKNIEDILIVFKINAKKNIDDILNLANKVDEPNKLIKIFRENKLNYLNYIYRTNDNYILTSSSQSLIIDTLESSNFVKKELTNYTYSKQLLDNFIGENNILLTKEFKTNKLLNKENYDQAEYDYIATLFTFLNKKVQLKSYLINNYKNVGKASYKKVVKDHIFDKNNYQIVIYNDFVNSIDYISLNSFDKAFLRELDEKLKQNILFLVSEENWVIIFDKNNKNHVSIDNTNFLKDYNQYSLENNNFIYKIYSKNILKNDKNIVKKDIYNNIFSAESDKFIFVSNSLINDIEMDSVSKEFLDYQSKIYPRYFLNNKINFKNPSYIEHQNISFLNNFNYFFKNYFSISPIEFKAVIKQSIPEIMPIYYSETILEIL